MSLGKLSETDSAEYWVRRFDVVVFGGIWNHDGQESCAKDPTGVDQDELG